MVRPEARLPVRRSCCVGLAGESPVAVSAVAPRSRSPSEGEIRPSKRDVECLARGVRRAAGSNVAGPTRKREPSSLERLTPKGEEAEPFMAGRRQQTALGRRSGAGLLRGSGEGTRRQPDTEQERSSSAARTSGRAERTRPSAKPRRAERKSEGFVVPLMPRATTAVEGRDPALIALDRVRQG